MIRTQFSSTRGLPVFALPMAAAASLGAVLLLPSEARAVVPGTVTHQGRLFDLDGVHGCEYSALSPSGFIGISRGR